MAKRTGSHSFGARTWIVLAVAAFLMLGGGGAALLIGPGGDAAQPAGTPSNGAARVGAADGFQDPASAAADSRSSETSPTRLLIPAIGVDAGFEQLALGAAGELQPPVDWDSVGWYADGVVPGQIGPAVIAGHVDSTTGPAVFIDLEKLKRGDEVTVQLSDDSTQSFRVTGTERVSKDGFPSERVYGPTPTPTLRLITCDGTFDPAIGHYDDNLIVYAELAS